MGNKILVRASFVFAIYAEVFHGDNQVMNYNKFKEYQTNF